LDQSDIPDPLRTDDGTAAQVRVGLIISVIRKRKLNFAFEI